MGRFNQIDGANQFASGYVGMGNNPVNGIDPDGQLFFLIPQIGWSKKGGLSLGLEVGVGVPWALSASVTGGYSFGSGKGYGSVQGSAMGFYAGYGTQGGFGGWGYRYAGFSAGLSYGKEGFGVGIGYGLGNGFNNGSLGLSWSQKGGLNYSAGASSMFMFGTINTYMMNSLENRVAGGNPVEFSAKSILNIYNDNYGDLNLPITVDEVDVPFLAASNGGDAIAQTSYKIKGQTVSRYSLKFSRAAFTSREQLAFSLVHELGHVIHNRQGLDKLAYESTFVDNLILIGSPISTKSDLYKQLTENKNIGNVIRFDIPGDKLSNPKSILEYLDGGLRQNIKDSGPHFNLARPGVSEDKLIQTVTDWLKSQGVN